MRTIAIMMMLLAGCTQQTSKGIKTVDRANNDDYLFLLSANGADGQKIIDLCKALDVRAVLLNIGVWCDWTNPREPYATKPEGQKLIASLHDAGINVGCHSFAHKVSATGFYATYYPQSISAASSDGRKNFTWADSLPERAAFEYAKTIERLGVSWIYLDGAEGLSSNNADDRALNQRMTDAVMKSLSKLGVEIQIFQESSYSNRYVTRSGQTDYWQDDFNYFNNPLYVSPIESIKIRSRKFAALRSRNVTPDLGWFGRVHVVESIKPFTVRDRNATMEEWQFLCDVSLKYDAPIGIRTTYDDWMADPLREKIERMVRETIAKRRKR